MDITGKLGIEILLCWKAYLLDDLGADKMMLGQTFSGKIPIGKNFMERTKISRSCLLGRSGQGAGVGFGMLRGAGDFLT